MDDLALVKRKEEKSDPGRELVIFFLYQQDLDMASNSGAEPQVLIPRR
jgi:hypothetical protein